MTMQRPARRRPWIADGLFILLTLIGAAPSAGAQETLRRPGQERTVVVQLAYALGEAHALHRLCAGPADATWYARMQRLMDEEADAVAPRRQLAESFNAGYAARQSQFTGCSRHSRAVEEAVAARGRALAERLASPAAQEPPP